MIDLDSKVMAIKAAWIKRLLPSQKWSNVIKQFIHNSGFTVETLLKCTLTTMKSFSHLSFLPEFYPDIFMNFSKSKQCTKLHKSSDVLSEIIWGNELFQFKNKCLYFKNWIESGLLYVKDLFSKDGTFIDEKDVLIRLKHKSNWISEFFTIKSVFSKLCIISNTSQAQYVNIKPKVQLFIDQKYVDISNSSSMDYYKVFVDKKFKRPKMEHIWCNEFNIDEHHKYWEDIYTQKVQKIPFQKLKEFNYKILTNILVSGSLLSRWNKTISGKCNC